MRPIVVKIGGSLLQKPALRQKLLKEIARISRRNPILLVHGGGPEITQAMAQAGIPSRFVRGLRYTDKKAMAIVERVLFGEVNRMLVGELNRLKCSAVGLSGRDARMLSARRISGMGRVGEVTSVHLKLLGNLLKGGFLPVVSSVGQDKKGHRLNLNADSVAWALASAFRARRLMMLTDVPGVLDKKGRTIPKISARFLKSLVRRRIITGGMIPKISSACRAVRRGVGEVWITDGQRGLTRPSGTRIVH